MWTDAKTLPELQAMPLYALRRSVPLLLCNSRCEVFPGRYTATDDGDGYWHAENDLDEKLVNIDFWQPFPTAPTAEDQQESDYDWMVEQLGGDAVDLDHIYSRLVIRKGEASPSLLTKDSELPLPIGNTRAGFLRLCEVLSIPTKGIRHG